MRRTSLLAALVGVLLASAALVAAVVPGPLYGPAREFRARLSGRIAVLAREADTANQPRARLSERDIKGEPLAGSDTTVDVQLLAINDFHGALEPAAGGTGRVGSVDAGGVEYLAAHLARLKADAPNTFVVSAGDNIGASPLLSSLFHDEPTIEALNLAGLQISALGNHDLDEGWWELLRMRRGGCHPTDGCQDGTPFDGASFTYLAANVMLDPRHADAESLKLAGIEGLASRPLLPGHTVREVEGVRIGFIGIILDETPSVILARSIRGLTFTPEADAANAAARTLRDQGVRAIVVLMHEGGDQAGNDINSCTRISRGFRDLIERLSDDIDVVVSGHSHQAYNCMIDGKVVTSAASAGRLVTDIDLRIRRSDGEIVAKSARNLVVTREIAKDAAQTALLARYRPAAEGISNRVVGSITASLTRAANEAGESTLGDVVADALLEAARRTPPGDADIAMWNPGGIRADLVAKPAAATTPVTFAQVFSVLPFGNDLIVKSISGAALLDMLEQQFGIALGAAGRVRIMQVSNGFRYAYDPSAPPGRRIDPESMRINGERLVPARQYRLATSNFLWGSGDGLAALSSGTNPVLVGVDYEILANYLSRHSPLSPRPLDRIQKIR